MEQSGPLEALHDVQVNDVDIVLVVKCLEDGLVGGEIGEFHMGAYGVVALQGGEELLGVG